MLPLQHRRRSSAIHRLLMAGAALAMAVAAPLQARDSAAADERPGPAELPVERIAVQSGTGTGPREVEGRVILEAIDGGLLVERFDTALELLQPSAILSRQRIDPPRIDGQPPADESAEVVGRRVLAELPQGFELLVTRHYCVCHDTSRAYAQWCAALFERLHDAFTNYWRKAGLEVASPTRPLVVVIFSDQPRYAAHAAAALGPAADRVAGYYDLMSNRIVTYDLTGSDALRQERAADRTTARLAILSSPAASGLVATLVHEATHQMAYNCGMHRRLAPVPLWVSEGVATYFETPDLDSSRGWRGIGMVNQPRLQQWRNSPAKADLASIVADDASFRDAKEGLDAYARAWALTFFLLQSRKQDFLEYLKILAEKRPLEEDSGGRRIDDFKRAFGVEPAGMEPAFVRFMDRLREK